MTVRVRWTFWLLVLLATGATGALSRAIAAEPSARVGVMVAVSALILATCVALALRILLVVSRYESPSAVANKSEPHST